MFVAGDGGCWSIRDPLPANPPAKAPLFAFAARPGAHQRGSGGKRPHVVTEARMAATWSPLQVVQEDGAHSLTTRHQWLMMPRAGSSLVYQRISSHLKETSRETATGWEGTNIYRNLLTVLDDDDGRTWSVPGDITRSPNGAGNGDNRRQRMEAGIQLKGRLGGRLIIPFKRRSLHQWNNYAIYSDDRLGTHLEGGRKCAWRSRPYRIFGAPKPDQ